MVRDAAVWVRPERDADGYLPEGPRAVTLVGREAIAWVNMQTAADATSGAIHVRFWDTGEVRRFDLPDRPGFLVPTDRPDTLLVGLGKRVVWFDVAGGGIEELARIPDDSPRTTINDGEPTPDGRVIFGTKDVRFAEPLGHLYLFDPRTRRLTILAGGMTCSNGKVVRGDTVFDIDTPRRRIDRYTLAGDRLIFESVALDLSAEPGFPDGICDGGDGTVIVAFYDPEPAAFGRAVRFDLATGERLAEWRTPGSPRVTCPLVVRGKLVLTTAVEGMAADQWAKCPNAGCLFVGGM